MDLNLLHQTLSGSAKCIDKPRHELTLLAQGKWKVRGVSENRQAHLEKVWEKWPT